MSNLTSLDKRKFEDLFGMESGYVLDFTNRSFADFIKGKTGINIYDGKYAQNGESKARRLREFWAIEPDITVGKVLSSLLEHWRYLYYSTATETKKNLHNECQKLAQKISGSANAEINPEVDFLQKKYANVNIAKLNIEPLLLPILESRLQEAIQCLHNNSSFSVVILCGSILEGLLLGTALTNPQIFNTASSSPKDNEGKVKKFNDWSLAQFIDVAYETDFLKLDVKKFSQELREFRNYIHPYQQMASKFSPDKHTAEICLQVLKAAIASLAKERP